MADFATLQDLLPPRFALMLGIPCDWAKQPRALHQSARAEIDILAESSAGGWDEQRAHAVDTFVTDENGDVLTTEDGNPLVTDDVLTQQVTVTGQREFTLSCTVWSPVQLLGSSARNYLERLRLRLMFPSHLDALEAMGLSLIETHAVVASDPGEDNRLVSMATMDVRFAHAQSEADAPVGVIARAHVFSQSITHADGSPAGAQMDRNIPE